jgi:hypothetical protein
MHVAAVKMSVCSLRLDEGDGKLVLSLLEMQAMEVSLVVDSTTSTNSRYRIQGSAQISTVFSIIIELEFSSAEAWFGRRTYNLPRLLHHQYQLKGYPPRQ